jgi:competence protein ComEC
MYPLLWAAIAFGFGVAMSQVAILDWRIGLTASAVLCLISILVRGARVTSYLTLGCVFFLGAFIHQFQVANLSENRIRHIYDEGRFASGTPVEVEGALIGRPETAYEGAFIKLNAELIQRETNKQDASGIVRFFLPLHSDEQVSNLRSQNLRSGDRIRIACELIREDQFLNPGVMPRRQLLDQQGIDASCTVKSPLLIEVVERPGWVSPIDFVYERRQWLIEEFIKRFSPSTASVMIASLLGDKHFLDKDTAEVFRDGGTFHVLVISGLHITFIGGILLWLVSRFTQNRWVQFAVTCLALWLYTLAVGAEVPVVRACIMFTALMLGRALYRTSTLLNTLGLCCLILLAWRPADLFNPSFQLTIVSVAAIVGMAFPIIGKLRSIGNWMPDTSKPFPPNVPGPLRSFCELLYWREHVWEIEQGRQIWSAKISKAPLTKLSDGLRLGIAYLFEGVVVSVIVQLCLLPLLIYYFHRVSPVSVILNLWVGAVIAAESFAAILTVVFGQASETLALPFAILTNGLNWLLVEVPRLFTHFDWASFRVPIYPGLGKGIYLIYFIPVIALASLVHRWDPFALLRPGKGCVAGAIASILLILLIASIIVFHPFSAPRPEASLKVEFLDVGQGDATFITFPNGETMLIDGGGRVNFSADEDEDSERFEPDVPRIGETVVSEFLWEKGYSRVDHLVVSHADADHAQGLVDVIRNFSVGAVYFGSVPNGLSDLDELKATAQRSGVSVKQIGRGDVFEIGGVRIEVLWPVKSESQSGSDNNSSLVLRFVYGEISLLFTGDIEKETETELISNGSSMASDVVKVPHHGSRTSSTPAFVHAVKSNTAVVPVGRRSLYGHPHRDVVERWASSGSDVIETGSHGTVTITTDGRTYFAGTYLP